MDSAARAVLHVCGRNPEFREGVFPTDRLFDRAMINDMEDVLGFVLPMNVCRVQCSGWVSFLHSFLR